IARAHPCGPGRREPIMESTFRGVFLTCTDAEATAAFHRDIADLPLEATGAEDYTYFAADLDGAQIALHRAAACADCSFPPVAESNLAHLYFRTPDQAERLERLRHAGTPLIAAVEVVATADDPDGRTVMLGTA